MSYTPIGWQTGDTITAEKLNKMDPWWSMTDTRTLYCNETVTTAYDAQQSLNVGSLSYSTAINAESVIITFDGVEYACSAINAGSGTAYGGFSQGPDFSEYPFFVYSETGMNVLYTATAGTYAIKIESVEISYEISSVFSGLVALLVPVFRAYASQTTWQEVHDAVKAGKIVYILKDTESDDNELLVQIVTRVFIDENTGDYCVEATSQPNGSSVGIVGYLASTANSPIEAR